MMQQLSSTLRQFWVLLHPYMHNRLFCMSATYLLMAWAGSEQLVLFFSLGSLSWLGLLY